jgi:hypothetical protein
MTSFIESETTSQHNNKNKRKCSDNDTSDYDENYLQFLDL